MCLGWELGLRLDRPVHDVDGGLLTEFQLRGLSPESWRGESGFPRKDIETDEVAPL